MVYTHTMKAFWSGILSVFFFIVAVLIGGFLQPEYSHASQLISELYATNTPYQDWIRYGGMIPAGLFFIMFSFFSWKILPKSKLASMGFFIIGFFYGFGTILVALFPCDEGCNSNVASASLSQLIHTLIGLTTYFTVIFGLIALSVSALEWYQSKQLAYIGFLCSFFYAVFSYYMFSDIASPYIGLFQRLVEGSVLFWIGCCAFYVRSFSIKNRLV